MTDAAQIHAAILAAPGDIALRLDFADAIDGSDPDWAELIRAQITAGRYKRARPLFSDEPEPEDIVDAGRRGYRLIRKIGDRITAPITALVRKAHITWGFPEVAELSGKSFLTSGRALYDLAPVRHVDLYQVDAAMIADIAGSPLLDRLETLILRHCPIGSDGVRALVASEHLRGLRVLDLSHCAVGQDGAIAIAEAAPTRLPSLQWLGFAGNTPFIPYGEGWDAISGDWPVDVYIPELGVRLDEQYGPFPWMRQEWAWHVRPDFGTI